jgi:2-keto-4-pentenoate hydratase/2-oxohepta-3-ene-1,7-dioic acid hydratase in catechol pathway
MPDDLEAHADPAALDPADVALLAPLAGPGKIICVGLNYHDHCREQGIDAPAYPMLFAKFANAVSDPGAEVVRPRATEKLDLECELAVVIGQRTSRVGRDEAPEAIFGYTILNDVTMRDLQREDRQWLRAKGSDGFAPMGPVVVTADEVGDPQALGLRSTVNGEVWQHSSTAEMVFDVATVVAFASRTITLEPGDVIATGTPAGVGHFQSPPRYLGGGDVMRCEIEGIGVLENRVVDEEPRTDDHARAAGIADLAGAPQS